MECPVSALHDDLCIVVPARNEAEHIGDLLQSLARAFPGAAIVVVDNASSDGTAAAAHATGLATVISEPKRGKGHAMRAGAMASNRRLVLFHDADREYVPRDALPLVDAVRRDDSVMAVGVRSTTFGGPAWSSLFAAAVVRWVLVRRWGEAAVGNADVLCGTRVLSRERFLELSTEQAGFRIETELSRLALRTGLRFQHFPVSYHPRGREEGKKIRPAHLWGILLEAAYR